MYREFAKIYDSFMTYCDYDKWSELVVDILEEEGIKDGELLDIGCGTGETLVRLKDKFSCTGLDLSMEMLKVAKKKLKKIAPEIELYNENMVDFQIGKSFNGAIALFDTVNHILYMEELAAHFRSVSNHLNPDGIYIFDIVDRTFMDELFPCDTYVDKRKNMVIIWEHEEEEGIDFIDATYLVKNKMGTYDMREETYEKKIFTKSEIEEALMGTGLNLVRIVENSEIAGRRYFYVLKK